VFLDIISYFRIFEQFQMSSLFIHFVCGYRRFLPIWCRIWNKWLEK